MGQLGDGTGTQVLTPKVIAGTWSDVSAGNNHTCGIQQRALFCWGANQYGQLGDGTVMTRFEPVQVGMDTDWARVHAGFTHTCARKIDGRVACWGSNRNGEIGDGTAWRSSLMLVVQ